jgi:uncharacterized protein YbjT (DUF2867 family)
MSGKHVLITGATGMIGGIVLRKCLERDDVELVTTLTRRRTGVEHEKLKEVLHDNFLEFPGVIQSLQQQDVAFFCIGAYTGVVSDVQLKLVTYGFVRAFVDAFYKESPDAVVSLLSGHGADESEQSRVAFSRYKGMAENVLRNKGFKRVDIFRPGYIYPVTPRKEPNIWYRLFRYLYPAAHVVYPNIGVTSEQLANVMVETGLREVPDKKVQVFENRAIREFSR